MLTSKKGQDMPNENLEQLFKQILRMQETGCPDPLLVNLSRNLNGFVAQNEFERILHAIKHTLPKRFKINNIEYSKDSIVHLKEGSAINGLYLKLKNGTVITLFGQFVSNNGGDLVCGLSLDEYNHYILNALKTSTEYQDIYIDLVCFNLIDLVTRTKDEKILKNIKIRQAKTKSHTNESKASKSLDDLISKEQPVLYFHHHENNQSVRLVVNRINQLSEHNIKYFFLELPALLLKPLFDTFNQTGNTQLLLKHLRYSCLTFPNLNPYFAKLAKACFDKGIQVIPVDACCSIDNLREYTASFAIMQRDSFMLSNISNHIKEDNFLGLFGLAHLNIANELNALSVAILSEREAKKYHSLAEQCDQIMHTKAAPSQCCSLTTMGLFTVGASVTIASIVLSNSGILPSRFNR